APPDADPNAIADDLVLIEKREYGSGPKDIDQVTVVRRYREKPINQYFEVDPNTGAPDPAPNNEDDIGWLEIHDYDWRQRDVYVEWQDASGAAMQWSLTWYDNLDRVIFEAEYAAPPVADIGGGADPRLAAAGTPLPTAAAILGAAVLPTSLTEYVYNEGGLVEETREYRITATPDPSDYTATYQYYNHQGKPLEVRAPGAPVQLYVYDAKGRQIKSISAVEGPAGLTHISMTEMVYDSNDRVTQSTRYERRHDASPSQLLLDSNNAIVTYTHTWYDDAGRTVATASYGTADAGDRFVNAAAPSYDPDISPAEYDANGVLIGCNGLADATALCNCYDYDDEGRQYLAI
ncbi:MAG: hypothetical protein D6744_09720, partial [Planctomycetota bacterium]